MRIGSDETHLGAEAELESAEKATPCTAAITGTGILRQTITACGAPLAPPGVRAVAVFDPVILSKLTRCVPLAISPKFGVSRPAQKARPSPESTNAFFAS
jgi:hypothetical protein